MAAAKVVDAAKRSGGLLNMYVNSEGAPHRCGSMWIDVESMCEPKRSGGSSYTCINSGGSPHRCGSMWINVDRCGIDV